MVFQVSDGGLSYKTPFCKTWKKLSRENVILRYIVPKAMELGVLWVGAVHPFDG